MKKLLIFTLLICIALPWSCKKYEDDDYWFTLRTPLNRIKGNKQLVEAKINDVDILPLYKSYFGLFYFEFTNEKLEGLDGYHLIVRDSSSGQEICQGYWGFNYPGDQKNKGKFYVNFISNEHFKNACLQNYDSNNSIYGIGLGIGGDIIKLSKKELWVYNESTLDNNLNLVTLTFKFNTNEE